MDFRDAMRLLGKRVTQEEVADLLGVSHSLVRQAMLPDGASGYRKPPPRWPSVVTRLARERAQELEELAGELGNGEEPQGRRVLEVDERELSEILEQSSGRIPTAREEKLFALFERAKRRRSV